MHETAVANCHQLSSHTALHSALQFRSGLCRGGKTQPLTTDCCQPCRLCSSSLIARRLVMQGTLWLANAIRPPHVSTGHFTFHPCCRTDLCAHRASSIFGFAYCWRLLETVDAGSRAAALMLSIALLTTNGKAIPVPSILLSVRKI